jgi:hypothetical protein
MGILAEKIDEDPDVSLFEIKPKVSKGGKPKAKAGKKRSRAVSSSSEELDKVPPYTPLEAIPYALNILNGRYEDTCSPDDWEANTKMWGLQSGAITQSQANHVLAQVHAPIWGIKTADAPSTTKATIILSRDKWAKIIDGVNQREKDIQIADQKGQRKPKSMLPLLVVRIEEEVSSSKGPMHLDNG